MNVIKRRWFLRSMKVSSLCRCLVAILSVSLFVYLFYPTVISEESDHRFAARSSQSIPLVFIGGHPRSGTTLLRVLLDVHPSIRCGPETHILVRILKAYSQLQTPHWIYRLKAAGLYPNVTRNALRSYILTLISQAGPPADVLCNKDPLALLYIPILHDVFPEAKFIHMVRDGRAVVASMIKRNVSIGNRTFDEQGIFARWENFVGKMLNGCEFAKSSCINVKYEELVLRPNKTMHRILEFLELPWNPIVLQHEAFMKNHTVLSSLEPSTSQVVHPINIKTLDSWASVNSVLSRSFIETIHQTSSIMKSLGYASLGIPPAYGKPEPEVERRTKQLMKDSAFRMVFD